MADSFRLPSVASAPAGERVVEYEAARAPVDTHGLLGLSKARLSAPTAEQLVTWFSLNEPSRAVEAERLFRSCGATLDEVARHPEQLQALGRFLVEWAPSAFAPWVGPGKHWWESPSMGVLSSLPETPGYSAEADMLHTSLSLDLLFLVVVTARSVRPDLHWGRCQVLQRRAQNARPTPLEVPVVLPTAPAVLAFRATWRFLKGLY